VLPFTYVSDRNWSGAPLNSYLTTALVNKLGEQAELKVVPLNRIPDQAAPKEQAKGRSWSDPQATGRKLGTAYVLTGRMTELSDNNLSLHLELIPVQTGFVALSLETEIKSTLADGPFQKEVDRVTSEVVQKVRAKIDSRD
jgi:TolB-like protein